MGTWPGDGMLPLRPANDLPFVSPAATMEVMNLIEQPIKVTEWQQTYTYDSGIHSGANTCVPSVSSKGLMEEDEACGRQYTLKKTTTYTQAVPQSQGQEPRGLWVHGHTPAENQPGPGGRSGEKDAAFGGGTAPVLRLTSLREEAKLLQGAPIWEGGRFLFREGLCGAGAEILPTSLREEARSSRAMNLQCEREGALLPPGNPWTVGKKTQSFCSESLTCELEAEPGSGILSRVGGCPPTQGVRPLWGRGYPVLSLCTMPPGP